MMLATDRAVLIRYSRDGQSRRGSGLRIGGRHVLTADHCANGSGHVIVTDQGDLPASVFVRSGNPDVDVAILECPALVPMEPLRCAVVAWDALGEVRDCQALGFPVWKDGSRGPRLAQVPGYIPAGEGREPGISADVAPPMSLKITGPAIRERVPAGELDQAGSPWAGMSGAVVVTSGDLIVGVIRGHSPAEGTGSLTATRLAALARLPDDIQARFLAALQAPEPRQWQRFPRPDGGRAEDQTAHGQVVVGEIPREPPAFVTRETIARLARAAVLGRVAVVCAVTGLRGVGKTQIAAAYARGCAEEGWGLVGWVNAETSDSLLAGLARMAARLGVADPDGDSLESARRLREHLQIRDGRSLLVFDNATDPDRLRPFLPATGATQLVITSTDQAFTEFGEPVDVESFTRPESVAYLQERTGLADEDGADVVSHELGDLPLALAQAAATIRRRKLTYSKYLEMVRKVPVRELLGRVIGGDYPHATAAALLLSIQAAEASNPAGLTSLLLRVLSVLSPDGTQRDMLCGLVSGNRNDGELDSALEHCVTGSLLTWSTTGEAVIMHRLLARVLRERDQASGLWDNTVAATLNLIEPHLFPEDQAWTRREEGSALVADIEALWESGRGTQVQDRDLVVRQLGMRAWSVRQLRASADLIRAIDLGLRVLADREQALGADHPDTLASQNDLAYAYESAGRLGEAVALYERTLAERERVLGADHPDTLSSRNNLADAYELAGRSADAIPLFERTLAERERVLGADHPDTLSSRNNLASAYESVGRLGEAVALYKRTLAERERVLGAGDPRTLLSRNNLAFAYVSAGRLGEAIRLFEETLAERERVLGADHPDTLTSRSNLAGAYDSAGRLGEAVPLYERTLAEREQVLGADHPKTLVSRNNLAYAYISTGRLGEAIRMFEETLAERERVLGADHPDTLTSRHNLASAYVSAGRLGEAVPLYERALAERERVLGADHPGTLLSRSNLAYAYVSAGRLGEAVPLYERTLADCERVLGADHPTTHAMRGNLERALTKAKLG